MSDLLLMEVVPFLAVFTLLYGSVAVVPTQVVRACHLHAPQQAGLASLLAPSLYRLPRKCQTYRHQPACHQKYSIQLYSVSCCQSFLIPDLIIPYSLSCIIFRGEIYNFLM